jgi:hypothetical protein
LEDFEFDFEKLKVYQKALEFIDSIFEIYKALPHVNVFQFLTFLRGKT